MMKKIFVRGVDMESRILDTIPLHIDPGQILKQLRIKEGSGHWEKLKKMVDQAQEIGRPKAFYRMAYVDERTDDRLKINGVWLSSRVLKVNLEKAHRVFPFVATCGRELEKWSQSFPDLLEKYWAEAISEGALRQAVRYVNEYLVENFRPGNLSRMNPGSLPDWPLPEQRPLFEILGDGPGAIGIQLTEHFLMLPIKSVSGIWFPAEESFESCGLCPRPNCPGRRAPHDKELYGRKYRKET